MERVREAVGEALLGIVAVVGMTVAIVLVPAAALVLFRGDAESAEGTLAIVLLAMFAVGSLGALVRAAVRSR